jgi:N utilization substance protein B
MTGAPVEDLLAFSWEEAAKLEKNGDAGLAFSRLLVCGVIENLDAVDSLIKTRLKKGWDISRLGRVERAILRLSVYSLVFQKELDAAVVIEEAVGLCLEYGEGDSFRFVNGILDGIGGIGGIGAD